MNNKDILDWRVHTPQLLEEIMNNNETRLMSKPIEIFASLLGKVGEVAAEINDPKLNALMCRLTIYSISDPYSPDYNKELAEQVIKGGR